MVDRREPEGNTLMVEAPAKVNLSLRVLGKRGDGFHDLETRMVPLDLGDRLEVTWDEGGDEGWEFECSDPELPRDESNLAVRAARDYLRASGCGGRVGISLEKRVPSGAGLGGGSSDAAAVLCALDALVPKPLGEARLADIAAGIGSDVPFFVYGRPCDCRGRGEIVEPLAEGTVPALPILLIKPEFGISTPWAYGALAESQELEGVSYGEQEGRWGTLVNDLERPAFEKYPFLGVAKSWLLARPEVEAAAMSGSGSTMFAILRDGLEKGEGEALLEAARGELDPELWGHLGRVVG